MDQNMDNNQQVAPEISIPSQAINNLIETGKWTKFLSIVGFIFIGIMIVIALFTSAILSNIKGAENALPYPSYLIGIIYILIAGLYFFPVLYLYKFSTNVKKSLTTNNLEGFNTATKNLKSHFKFIGILTIIALALYLPVIIAVSIFSVAL